MLLTIPIGAILLDFLVSALAAPTGSSQCQDIDVLILGAGSSGISAAKALGDQNITNFAIVEYTDSIGGRVRHTTFGEKPDKSGPYTLELGANWVQNVGNDTKNVNPIWALAKKYGLKTILSDAADSLATFDESGAVDYSDRISQAEDALSKVYDYDSQARVGGVWQQSIRSGLRYEGWDADRDPKAQAAEQWAFDYSDATSPDFVGSASEDVVESEQDEPDFGDEDHYVKDPRGYNYIFQRVAETFLHANDSRLHLNTIVTQVAAHDDHVVVHTANGTCFRAKHAVCTFSVGVLQNAALAPARAPVKFEPALPSWKQDAIAGFGMGIYTKIFMQFDQKDEFWPKINETNALYASPVERGWYPFWQDLSTEGYFPDSGMIFSTVTAPFSRKVEAQSDDQTKAEALGVLAHILGKDKAPEPIHFLYPRWGQIPWSFGSYSYWPTGYTAVQHQNLQANVGNLWFAGEHLQAAYQATVHGAWLSGEQVGKKLAACLKGQQKDCAGFPNANRPGQSGDKPSD